MKMKKPQSKRSSGSSTARGLDLKKPFGFCCDVKSQDPDTRYNRNVPPFKSSMANIFLNGGGPDLKFRIQDTGRPLHQARSRETRKVATNTSLGECSRCRGPLKWYLEDEISLARDMLAYDKQSRYNSDAERHLNVAIRKAKKRRERKRETKLKK